MEFFEARAILFWFLLVRDAGLLELDIKSDIQTVSMAVNIRSRPQATYIGLTIADIRDIGSNFQDSSFSFIPVQSRNLAHYLAHNTSGNREIVLFENKFPALFLSYL